MDEIIKVLGVLTAAYPTFGFTKETARVYADLLTDLEPELLRIACLYHISSSTFFPTVAEIRKRAAQIVTGDAMQDEDYTHQPPAVKATIRYWKARTGLPDIESQITRLREALAGRETVLGGELDGDSAWEGLHRQLASCYALKADYEKWMEGAEEISERVAIEA